MTTRDEVWAVALERAREEGAFRRSDLGFDHEQRHTVRRTLREMERLGWLRRTGDASPIWRAGRKAREHLRMDEDALAAAEPED